MPAAAVSALVARSVLAAAMAMVADETRVAANIVAGVGCDAIVAMVTTTTLLFGHARDAALVVLLDRIRAAEISHVDR